MLQYIANIMKDNRSVKITKCETKTIVKFIYIENYKLKSESAHMLSVHRVLVTSTASGLGFKVNQFVTFSNNECDN